MSVEQVSLTPRRSQALELVRTLDLRTIPFLDGSICREAAKDCIVLSTIIDIGLNIEVFSLKTLHVMHKGVKNELRTRD